MYKVDELNRVIRAISVLSEKNGASRSQVIAYCREQVIRGSFPNHGITISLAMRMGLINTQDSGIYLTELGKKFHDLQNESDYELSSKQQALLIDECFLNGGLLSETEKIVLQLVPSYNEHTFAWNEADNSPLDCDSGVFEMLIQLGFLTENETGFRLDGKYIKEAIRMRRNIAPKSIEELRRDLEENEEIGKIAEQIALDFERNRLRSVGCELEAKLVQRISELDVGAGYDIISFDRQNDKLIPDRFIEVKGSRGNNVKFYWTRNEIEKAKVLGQKYWIYFIGGIGTKNGSHFTSPVLIQDPYSIVLKKNSYYTECEVISVTRN
ncbi:MAG: protein NO VEIN domain-containing protein [Thermoplasmataceae archaeon]